MDKKSEITQLKDQLLYHPAHLWLGLNLEEVVIKALKTIFCSHNACNACNHCININQKTHRNVIWIYPQKGYVLEDLEPIMQTIVFKLEPNEHLFFILQKGETLSGACANKLLKFLEEPPAGYHSIITSSHIDSILPTIQSRCLIKNWLDGDNESQSPLVEALIKMNVTGSTFLSLLAKEEISEYTALHFAEKILIELASLHQIALQKKELKEAQKLEKRLHALKELLCMPPQTGSGKLFLKNLFLQFC